QIAQPVPVRLELRVDGRDVREGVGPRRVDDVHDEARSLDVTQELLSEAGALARSLDEPGDVGDHELARVESSDAEIRSERGERVGRDLRPRARQRREQARLPRVGQAGEADVRDEPELELELARLALLAIRRDAGGAPRARRETRVAASADAALRDDDLGTIRGEIGDLLTGRDVANGRAGRHAHDEVASGLAALVLALARGAVVRAELVL